ncbi:MAG TPA: 6-phosphogluconolactonase [Acidisphaera sp.]|nr:6-phosphogluconolactonase [Acidisphaera sp.]
MTPSEGTLHVYNDPAALTHAAAEWIVSQARAKTGRFVLVLSGGSTPRPVYEALARPPFLDQFPWSRTVFVIGDERFVPYEDPESNWGMIQAAMLDHVPVPVENLMPITTVGLTLEEAAVEYEHRLKKLHGADHLDHLRPLFDVCLLGLGDDGHTASLLPHEPVLGVTDRWVAPVPYGREEGRITLTYPALNSSAAIAFLVAGQSKRHVVDYVLSGATDIPAGRLRPAGEVHWFLDRAAAGDHAP